MDKFHKPPDDLVSKPTPVILQHVINGDLVIQAPQVIEIIS